MKPFLLFTLFLLAEKSFAQAIISGDSRIKKFGISSFFNGDQITGAIFDEAKLTWQCDTLVRVRQASLVGLVSETGRTVVPVQFDDIDQTAQVGFSIDFVGTKTGNLLGLWRISTGQMVLPQAFEWARGLLPDLVCGRREGSETLEFFDEKGQKRFELPGKTAWPGFDENSFQIVGSDPKVPGIYYYKNGRPVFSEKVKNAQWTDASILVVAEIAANRGTVRSAILTMAGDTILPMDSIYLIHVFRRQFLVQTTSEPKKKGLFDAETRRWIFPLEDRMVMKTGPKTDPNGAFYTQRFGSKEESRFLFDSTGRQIAAGFSHDILRPERRMATLFKKDHRPDRYFVANKSFTEQGLFSTDGRAIVPMEFSKIEYASEAHPVIVEKSVRYGDPNPVYNAFNLQTGQKLFVGDFQKLWFTANPRRFIAQKNERIGIVDVDKEAATRFDFDRLTAFNNLFFWARKGDKYHFIKPDGSLDARLVFDELGLPDRVHFEKFNAQKRGTERLVALGRSRERPKGYWYIDDRWQKTFIADPTMGEIPSPTSDWQVEEVVVEEPPPMIEESPRDHRSTEKIWGVDELDEKPAFIGGVSAVANFFTKNKAVPPSAKEKNLHGIVCVRAPIEKDGSIADNELTIVQSLSLACDEEAKRLVMLMPKWSPAKVKGQAVRTVVVIPVEF